MINRVIWMAIFFAVMVSMGVTAGYVSTVQEEKLEKICKAQEVMNYKACMLEVTR